MTFAVGALVSVRGREWVVLPESSEELLMLRPLGGSEDEVTGIYLPLEKVSAARFSLPSPRESGDFRSAQMLRDAVRLGFRSSAGPFRSFARLGVDPRPYQLVPLLMALKMDPVRLLIADDVGIGKTVEACLIARELLDRAEIQRLAVLCPPHLAEQWQTELRDKFHIDAERVVPSTAARLERGLRVGQSLFDVHPFVVVSTDFIKTERRLEEFSRTCPEFVIVDEAHTCAFSGQGRGSRHQRYRLISGLAKNPDRHLILLSATPHSGNEAAFRSLLGLLRPEFSALSDMDERGNVTQPLDESVRRQLAGHFVQRRRADIRAYLDSDTPFPDREEREATYQLSPDERRLFDRALRFARESVAEPGNGGGVRLHQRVRWWSALALLRSLASSPAAAAETLRNRAANADAESEEEADALGRRSVLDQVDDESVEGIDTTPGADTGDDSEARGLRRRLLEMAREAEALAGKKDTKLQRLIPIVQELIKQGFNPIVFCRYIPTAEYVAAALREKLSGVEVGSVTGLIPAAEREARVTSLSIAPKRVLVCTDCLSEGINLQQAFDSVLHYDLSWNPTRHEQREGRVDRYGQPKKVVRVLTYYGLDNQIDGIVLDVLVRKHKQIRSSLGVSVPVPVDSDAVVEAIFEGLLLRGSAGTSHQQLSLEFDDLMRQDQDRFHQEWENASAREKRSRTIFAQETIKPDEVAQELAAVRSAVGSGVDVARFTTNALGNLRAAIQATESAISANLTESSLAVRDAIGGLMQLKGRFSLPVSTGEIYLSRTHPVVEGLANFVVDSALDPLAGDAFAVRPARCGVTRTHAVETRTTLLLLRLRCHIVTRRDRQESTLLAEDLVMVAFQGAPASAVWLSETQAEALLSAVPSGSVGADQAEMFLQRVVDGYDLLVPHLETVIKERAEEILTAHRRVRTASKLTGVQYRVEPQLPPDVLAMYVFLPGGA